MNLLFIGMTISVIGKILLAYAVIRAHTDLAHEHQIDAKVIKSFKLERTITIFAVILIVIGYILEITFFGGFQNFFFCEGTSCAAALGNLLSN